MKKGSISLTTKTLFIIFIVIFAAFVTFSVIKSRTQVLKQREHFSQYDKVNSFFTALLTSPCVVTELFDDREYQRNIKGFFSEEKMNLLNHENSDLSCIDNFYFIYSVIVQDIINGKTWYLGLKEEPTWPERIIQRSLPVAINYDYHTVYPGRVTLVAYIGEESYLYNRLKFACFTKQEDIVKVELDNRVSYNNTKNEFCVEDSCFYPYFGCRINSFRMEKGKHLLYLKYRNNRLQVTA